MFSSYLSYDSVCPNMMSWSFYCVHSCETKRITFDIVDRKWHLKVCYSISNSSIKYVGVIPKHFIVILRVEKGVFWDKHYQFFTDV